MANIEFVNSRSLPPDDTHNKPEVSSTKPTKKTSSTSPIMAIGKEKLKLLQNDIDDDQAGLAELDLSTQQIAGSEGFNTGLVVMNIDGCDPQRVDRFTPFPPPPKTDVEVRIQALSPKNLRSSLQITMSFTQKKETEDKVEEYQFTIFGSDILSVEEAAVDHRERPACISVACTCDSEVPEESLCFCDSAWMARGVIVAISVMARKCQLVANRDALNNPTEAAKKYIELLTSNGLHDLRLLVLSSGRTNSTLLVNQLAKFGAAIEEEKINDPLLAWGQESPDDQHLGISNMCEGLDIPDAAKQPPSIIFKDVLQYQIPMAYSSMYENLFHALSLESIQDIKHDVKLVSMPGTSLGDGRFRCYLAWIKSAGNAQIPIRDKEKCVLVFDVEAPKVEEPKAEESEQSEKDKGPPQYLNPFEEDPIVADNTNLKRDPLQWLAYKYNAPNEPGWVGYKKYVQTEVPSLEPNFYKVKDLRDALKGMPPIKATMILWSDDKVFPDIISTLQEFCHRVDKEIQANCHYLLQPNGHGRVSNFHLKLKDTCFDATAGFTPSQKEAFDDLQYVVENMYILTSCPGSGKTHFSLRLSLQHLLACPSRKTRHSDESSQKPDDVAKKAGLKGPRKHQLLFTSESNHQVDEACEKFHLLALANGVRDLDPIRVHSIAQEKRRILSALRPKLDVLPLFDEAAAGADASRFKVASITNEVRKVRENETVNGDIRRVLEHMSLAARAITNLKKWATKDVRWLKLLSLLEQDLSCLTTEEITVMKEETDLLMIMTLLKAHAIFTTTSMAAKQAVYKKCNPTLGIVDEAGRQEEIKSLPFFCRYKFDLLIFSGDGHQMRPTCETVSTTPYVSKTTELQNPFGQQLILPGIFRWAQAGHPTSMLREYHRGHGGLQNWSNEQFYQGKGIDFTGMHIDQNGTINKHVPRLARAARGYLQVLQSDCKSGASKEIRVNRLIINVENTRIAKQSQFVSCTSPDQCAAALDQCDYILRNPNFDGAGIAILCMYSGEVASVHLEKNKRARERHLKKNGKVVDCSRIKYIRTVDGAQGSEADIVITLYSRDRGFGFTGEKHRLNVAASRAKYLDILVMDEYGMRNGRSVYNLADTLTSRYLFDLMQDTKKHGVVVDVIAKSMKCPICSGLDHTHKTCPAKNSPT